MKKIRIVHYGIGHDHSPQYLDCIKQFPDLFEIVGICEPNETIRRECSHFPAYDGLRWLTEDEMFAMPDIDAALVEAHDLSLVEYAQKCAEKGWHIHMDKAAGANIEAFHKLLSTIRKKKLVFQIGYMFRYNPLIKNALAMYKSGYIGEIFHIDAFMNTRFDKQKREWISNLPGGNMLYLGCHMIDLTYLFWGLPNRIFPLNKNTNLDGISVNDNAGAVLEYDKGVAFIQASAVEVNGFGRRQFVVSGSNATIEINPLEAPPTAKTCTLEQSYPYQDRATKISLDNFINPDRYTEMMQDFASYIHGQKNNPFTLEYEYQVQKMILAACGQDVDYKTLETI